MLKYNFENSNFKIYGLGFTSTKIYTVCLDSETGTVPMVPEASAPP